MKAMAQKFGGGGQQSSPAQAAAELAGKRLVPGHALPHVVLHTVQVRRTHTSLFSDASERVCDIFCHKVSTEPRLCYLVQPSVLAPLHHFSPVCSRRDLLHLWRAASCCCVGSVTTLVLPSGLQLKPADTTLFSVARTQFCQADVCTPKSTVSVALDTTSAGRSTVCDSRQLSIMACRTNFML